MKIYVASLSDYNNGTLFGKWFDLSDFTDADALGDAITEVLEERTEDIGYLCEEYAIHDYESPIKIEEHHDLDELFEYMAAIEEHGEEVVEAALSLDIPIDSIEDAYHGAHKSEQDYAEQLIDDCYDLEKTMGNLSYYFDYEKFANDLFMSDYQSYTDNSGDVHVFTTNW